MGIDLTRFHDTFFQESLEGLLIMESGLLAMAAATGEPNSEIIHNVFRAAHSIKGGSATFGFQEIAEFTHLLEAIFDSLRNGEITPDGPVVEVLLQAVDWLRELISARLEGREPDQPTMQRAKASLSRLKRSQETVVPNERTDAKISASGEMNQRPDLRVRFRPHKNLFYSGNDPLRYLEQLEEFGRLKTEIDLSDLPKLSDVDVEVCYLGWDVTMTEVSGTMSNARDVFEWIEADCSLEITELIDESVRQPPTEITKKSETAYGGTKDGSSIRVSTEKIDAVVNLVGELVITQSMLTCIGEDFQMSQLAKLREGIGQLARNTRELQETVLKIRMLPISNLFDRFPRLVHDLSHKLGKAAKLKISGEQTEVDKTVLEKLSDPLVHLVRNSMDHGIERPEVRRQAGKPDEGTLLLHAEHRGGNIVIEISDDGAGLNEARILARARERGLIGKADILTTTEIHDLIFSPGFSTVEDVTDLSGRGVGMDVVRRNVEELGGRIQLASRPGFGATTTIQLPLTLAIMEGQLLRVGDHRFVVPLVSIVESLRIVRSDLYTIAGGVQLYRLRDEYLHVVHLAMVFQIDCDAKPIEEGLLVVVESRGKRIALRVDDLLVQQQVVIKSLEANFYRVEGVAGATILGDGTVAMILDIPGILERSQAVPPCSYKEAERTYERVNSTICK